MGLSLSDLVSLAKAGYTPANVKELIALSEKSEPVKPEEQQSAAAANVKPKTASAEPTEATEKEAKPEKTEEKEIDYKELYELYEKSQEDLKKAQAVNRSADNSGKQTEYSFNDLLQTISEL